MLLSPRETQSAPKIDRADDGHALVGFQFSQVAVAGDDDIGVAGNGAFENAIVGRIVVDDIDRHVGNDDLSLFAQSL